MDVLKVIENKIRDVYKGDLELKIEDGEFHFILKDADVDIYEKLDEVYDFIYKQPIALVEKIFISTVNI